MSNPDDMTRVSRFLIGLIFSLSILTFYLLDIGSIPIKASVVHGTTSLDQGLRAVYRLACGYLALHTIVFWMVRNPIPGHMTPLFRDLNEVRPHATSGIERLVPFSSWTLIAFCFSMLINGFLSVYSLFVEAPAEWMIFLGSAMYGVAFSSAALTAVIVRHVILPDMQKQNMDMSRMFLKHEQMMHNFALIFLCLEMIFGWAYLPVEMIVLGFLYGSVYLVFAEYWATRGGGYYVYEFIDTRPKNAPILLLGLVVVCAFSFSIGVFALYLRTFNVFLGSLTLVIFLFFSTKFINPHPIETSS